MNRIGGTGMVGMTWEGIRGGGGVGGRGGIGRESSSQGRGDAGVAVDDGILGGDGCVW